MRTKIEVTQECIDKGEAASCSCCPVALALLQSLEIADVSVSPYKFSIRATGEDWLKDNILPEKAQIFINEFDIGWEVRPLTFSVNLPKKYLKQ